jgi:hypothetical protein
MPQTRTPRTYGGPISLCSELCTLKNTNSLTVCLNAIRSKDPENRAADGAQCADSISTLREHMNAGRYGATGRERRY